MVLPKWRRAARRPSCLDLVTLLRRQTDGAARAGTLPAALGRRCRFAQMVERAAA